MLIAMNLFGQKTKISANDLQIVSAEASILVPIGALSNKFDYAHSYGFWFRMAAKEKLFADGGISFMFLQNAREVLFDFNNQPLVVRSKKIGIDVGVRIGKITSISKKAWWEYDVSLAVHYLDYQFPKKQNSDSTEGKKEGELFKNAAILIAPELKYMYQNVGFRIQYRFTPMNMISGLEPNFGSQSICFGMVYKQ